MTTCDLMQQIQLERRQKSDAALRQINGQKSHDDARWLFWLYVAMIPVAILISLLDG